MESVRTSRRSVMNTANDWRALYPFKSNEIAIGSQRLHYLDEGEGEPLLLLHGNPTWSFYWRNLVLGLRDRYRLIVPDHIGCGLSARPTTSEYPFRLQRRIEDIVELTERLDLKRITLAAHDWGGCIGMGAAAARPDRFARFILMNTGAFRGGRCPLRIRICRTPFIGRLGVQGFNLFARAALSMATARPQGLPAAVRQGLLAPYDSWQRRTAINEFVRDIPLSSNHPSYQALSGVETGLAQFRNHPVCLIWGMQDWCFTPWFLERFCQSFPQAEVHRFDDAGHYVMEDAYERIVPIVRRFLLSS